MRHMLCVVERRSDMRNERQSSLEKALEVCEVLSATPDGASVSDIARAMKQPAPTVHRLLNVLKRRGYVRQDEATSRYALSLKMLDISFRLLGRSELRLHAYPVLREHVVRTGARAFVAVTASGEVTYFWSTGPDEVAMHSTYGRPMPGHCALYFGESAAAPRRLSCLKLTTATDAAEPEPLVQRLGDGAATANPILACTCAPVRDYSGREVARIGLFAHAADERELVGRAHRQAFDLARLVSLRLGHLPAATLAVTA